MLNNNSCESAELLARHCDLVLKKLSKISEENVIENALEDIVCLNRYSYPNDIFFTVFNFHR